MADVAISTIRICRPFLADLAEAVALLTFVASVGCGALSYVGA